MPQSLLVERMKIYSDVPLQQRVMLSNGIEEVKELNGMPCVQRAFVPKEPWRRATTEEIKLLQATGNDTDNYQTLGLLQLPPELKKGFDQLHIEDCLDTRDVNNVTNSQGYKQMLAKTMAYYGAWHMSQEPPEPHYIYLGNPRLRTTTFNRQENFFIGMHLDSWERKPMSERHLARNRICINLGKEPRYLLFFNLEYRDIVRMADMGERFMLEPHHPYEALYRFYELFPDYPVIKLQINPFEAYLAPTENVVHDGSTEGCTQKDINLAIRGYYKIVPQQNKWKQTLTRLINFKRNKPRVHEPL